MFKPVTDILKKSGDWVQVSNSFGLLDEQEVFVGIPQEKSSRPKDVINNAELGYILANGSPVHNILPRPFLQESLDHSKDKIQAQRLKIIRAALTGNKQQVEREIEKLGMLAQNIVKEWFTNPSNNWAPNKLSTIRAKKSDRPLIDTGQLRNSITYVVRNKA